MPPHAPEGPIPSAPYPSATALSWGFPSSLGRWVSDLRVGFPKVLRFVGNLGGSIPSASINSPHWDFPICPCPGYWGALGWGLLLLLALGMAPKTALS